MDSPGAAKVLVVGVGALGGVIAARLRASGRTVWLATRDAQQAARLKATGLHVAGIGGTVSVEVDEIAPLDAYGERDAFDLAVLATKAQDAMQAAPKLVRTLGARGVLLPIQNGGVAQALADRLGQDRVLGGLSNLGATMIEPGSYEQRNAGHLLVGELSGGDTARAERVRQAMSGGVEVAFYGDLKPSMLQDFERGRPTEIDFINGYVADVGRRMGIATPANAAIVETVYAITRGELRPDPSLLGQTLGSLG